ncbi:MAG: choice-of-anchor J domain-containing protein, partial [Bacteroidales bacterium]
MKRTVFLIILFSFSLFIYGQNSQNEGRIVPISQKIQNQTWLNRVTDLDFSYSILKSNFNWQSIKQEDSIRELQKLPRRIGLSLPIDLNLLNDIAPIDEDGYYIYRCKIYAEDAKKVGFVFDDFYLQPGDEIYIANENGQVIGPITEAENNASRMYSTIPINGQEITLIYVKQQNSLALSRLHLSEIVYIYYEEKAEKDLGDADDCQVNINCSPEGDNWQVQKRGVARIYFREGSSWYLCSGTLINNTANDGTPYFLTAYHCGGDATAADRNVWQFYFNYERPGCPNTGTPPNNVITGCTYKAGGDMNGGSDFQLLLLSSAPSLSWNPYYNGWSRSTTASPSGVSIHHPSGDAKKISTYTQTLGTGTWSGGMSSAHWTVRWAQTANGWGVTEGGSSGSPIFDNNKRIVGTLTGGSSTCNNPTYQDYYGKFSKHWDANGTTNDKKLQPWLDPLGTNPTTLDGYDPNNPSGVNNPQNFVATSISQTQIDLSWSLNSSNNPVLLVYNTTNTFGIPTNGTNYNVGQTIPGGGTVIYKGTNTSYAHTGLNAGTTYYYKIFSIATGNNYSSGLTAQATTWWQGAGFSLDFEACADWSTDFTPWTSYDGDGKDTYGSSDCNFTGEGTAFGFMAFNPSLAGCFDTHGGQRCGISICPADGTESNDWIISPQIQMNNNGSISFWVKSPKPGTWGEETYDVLVSTTNNQPSSFTAIATDEIAPASWTQKTYSLSAYNNQAIYVAIRHRATDKFMMMIDDIVIDTGTVSPTNPVASFTYSPSNICQGAQVQFTNTSQNATSYSWSFPGGNPSTSTQTNPVVTFNTAGNINVTLIAFNGTISDTIIQSITVNPLPIVSASANPSSICVGDSSIFSATGANTYNWSNGMSGSQITVSPATSSTYTVTGTNLNGCTNTATVSITVNASPTININANPQSICIGSSTIISASGATTYSWSNGMSGSQITVSPTNTTTYTVTGTNTFNCSNTATINITVETMPSAGTISASDNQLCQNELLTLTLNDYSPNSNIQWQI